MATTYGPCAVIDCENPTGPRTCPYDGRYHYHGRIHYDCGYPIHSIAFRPIADGWFYICTEHYELCKTEREAFVG